MKKVRFESPTKCVNRMDESDCHSPRPLLENLEPSRANIYNGAAVCAPNIYQPHRVLYSNDPVHRFDYSDSSPYPLAKKTLIPTVCEGGPSKDLNLSMLDNHDPRPLSYNSIKKTIVEPIEHTNVLQKVLTPIENTVTPPNVLCKDDNFFIRRDNLNKYSINMNPLQSQFNKLNFDKENNPLATKAEMLRTAVTKVPAVCAPSLPKKTYIEPLVTQNTLSDSVCSCHHCFKVQNMPPCNLQLPLAYSYGKPNPSTLSTSPAIAPCQCQPITTCFHCVQQKQSLPNGCHCTTNSASPRPQNAVDKKTLAVEKYEQSKRTECTDIEKQSNVSKEKREPTISDLLKIIKLQNEQLQLLQDKVDKFISTSNSQQNMQQLPVQNYMTEHVALQTIDSEHKISIGVMTSFEMVRTSTVINKEIVKQTNENAQVQCNRSQISIKGVVSKQPMNLNFLDGIMPVSKNSSQSESETNSGSSSDAVLENDIWANRDNRTTALQQREKANEGKTLNEMSLYNVQVDNSTTPLMSPEQSLYLDVRDYSDSESSNDDQSNVGWTYYNKVMTHVNGMLQDSEMASSASALCRNTRRQCMQMQFDKTNVSVTKRVKFGDDPLGIHQPHLYPGSSDTSLKMNQLAAKYLKTAPSTPQYAARPIALTERTDISFATRNYMERHKLLHGNTTSRSPPAGEIPRFLDITALKQQPKFL